MSFVVQKNSLHALKGIAVKLQKRDLDIYEAYQRVDETISCLQSYRTNIDEFHSRCYAEVKLVAEEISSVEEHCGASNIEQMSQQKAQKSILREALYNSFPGVFGVGNGNSFFRTELWTSNWHFFSYPQDSCSKAAKH